MRLGNDWPPGVVVAAANAQCAIDAKECGMGKRLGICVLDGVKAIEVMAPFDRLAAA